MSVEATIAMTATSFLLAGHADREAAGAVDGGHDLLIDRARQHHLDDLDGGAVSNAQPVDERTLDLEALKHRPDYINAMTQFP